jgi:glycogen synthase
VQARPLRARRHTAFPHPPAPAAPSKPLRVAVFTTSYPRHADDFAGRFVSDAVARLRERGVEVEVVAPGTYREFGLRYDGGGIVRALKRRPWLIPLLAVSMVRALRRAAKDADLVHAHWLAGGVVAALSGKPFVVTLHGTISGGLLDDFKLCRRAPWLVRAVLRRARVVICVSEALAEAARTAGARDVVFVPNGIELPPLRGLEEAEPLEVFYTGRLSPEKGIVQLAEATQGLNLVVCGDGPLRPLVPQALGFVSREELARRFASAAVVVCPSLSEGFGVVCGEAMAHGKPVVASAVGGLANLVIDEETGLLVPPGDIAALRAAIDRLLADREARLRMGRAARERIAANYSWERVTARTLAAYARATRPERRERRTAAALAA